MKGARVVSLRRRVIVAAIVLVGVSACGTGDESDPAATIDGTAYTAVIAQFMPLPSADPDVRRVVFVAGVSADSLSLEDQVAVIEGFAETHDVRFVDDITAAVDSDLPGSPPKDDGALIGIGTITKDAPHTVRVELYTSVDVVEARLVTIVDRDDEWVIDTVAPVEPEVLLDDE